MALLDMGTAPASTIGNPLLGSYFIFLDSDNSDKLTSRDSDGVDTVYGSGGSVSVKNSIEIDAGDLQLVGDLLTPGSTKYYGTDKTGTKGFYSFQNFNINLDSAETSVTRVVAGGRTTWTITHNLNSLDLSVEVFRISNGRTIGLRIERTGVDTIEASRSGTIADGTYRIIIK